MDYKSPLGNIIQSHGLTAHFYADETQIYIAFDYDNEASSMAKLEECIVVGWLPTFFNSMIKKPELIFIGTSQNLYKRTINYVKIGDSTIEALQYVRNIAAIFDQHLKMEQVTAICKSSWFKLYQISKIRPYLSIEETKSIVHAYVTSKIKTIVISLNAPIV